MTTVEAIKHFGSAAELADALGVKPPSISQWGERPPVRRQYEIQEITNGELKVEKPNAA